MISYWSGVNHTKKDLDRLSMDEFLERIQNGYWKLQIELLRSEPDEKRQKEIKKTLPAVTVGGVFGERKENSLEKHSGFICIDIDGFNDRTNIDSDEYTYASFLSTRGNGIAVICKCDPSKHKESYNFISEYYFNKFGIVVDEAPKNVASARFVSYDENLFINKKSKKLKTKVEPKSKKLAPNLSIVIPKTEVGSLVDQVNTSVVDDYRDYLNLSFSLSEGFGEEGRVYFHKISSFSAKYDFNQAEKQYDIALKRKSQGITVGTFYYYLKQAGVDLSSYNADKAISNIKLNKRMNLPRQQSIQELVQEKGIDENEASQIVDEVYTRNDLDIRNEKNTENIIINVTNYLIKKYNIRHNEVSRKNELNGRPLIDKDANTIYLDCRMTFDDNAVTFDLVNRILESDAVNSYNPFLDYIQKNRHRVNNEKDLVKEICETIKFSQETDPYYNAKKSFIRKWLIGIIASVYGTPVRYVLALTGGQNTGKTEWFRRLLPMALQHYYAESNLDRGKDDELLMCEKLIIVDDEMGGKSKQDEKKFKELTSKNYFSLRASYGRYNQDYKRLAILGGTSNDAQLINDSTGNTRILPINVISIDHEKYNSINKDDLFMQLVNLYENGETFHLSEIEFSLLNEISRGFESIAYERELISKFYVKGDKVGLFLTATEIKDTIESLTKQKIMSMKKFGTELRNLFGAPKFKDRQSKYYVERTPYMQ
jgi:predicted P-loop ATPase